MADHDNDAVTIPAQGNPAVFCLAMIIIEERESVRVTKNGRGTLETHFVFLNVLLCLYGVPLKMISQFPPRGK